jgi:hypothetical protein
MKPTAKSGIEAHRNSAASGEAVRLVLSLTAVAALLRLILAVSITSRAWGCDYLGLFGVLPALLFTALPILGVWLISLTDDHALETVRGRRLLVAGITLAALALCLFMPLGTAFYGDGGLLTPQVFRLAAGEAYDAGLFLNLKSSPLPGLLILGLAKAIPSVLNVLSLPLPSTAFYPFQGLSILLLLAGALLALRNGARDALRFAALFGTAYGVFFLGYVEFYLPVFLFLSFFLGGGERVLESRQSRFGVGLLFVLAILSHYSIAALIPAFLYLFFQHKSITRPRMLALAGAGFFIAWLAVYFAGGLYASDNRIIMPLIAPATPAGVQTYTLLSSYHLGDLANLLMLANPVAALAILVMLFHRRASGFFTSPVIVFHLLALTGFGLFLFFANTSLGLARDWDLTAPLGVIITSLAIALVRSTYPQEATRASLLLVASGILFAVPWYATHLSPALSARRFENILRLDSAHIYRDYALSGYEALRKYHQNAGNTAKDIALSRAKVEILDYPQHYLEFLTKLYTLVNTAPAEFDSQHAWLVARLQRRAEQLRQSGVDRDYSLSLGQIDSVAAHVAFHAFITRKEQTIRSDLAEISRLTGGRQTPVIIEGMERFDAKRYAEAVQSFREADSLGFRHPRFTLLYANALSIQSMSDEAIMVLEKALPRFPTDIPLLLALAKEYLRVNRNPARVVDLLEQAQGSGPNARQQQEIDAMLRYMDQRIAK